MIRARVSYESKSWHPFDPKEHTSEFDLEVKSYEGTDASEANAVAARRAIEKIPSELQRLRRAVEISAMKRAHYGEPASPSSDG